jgi:thiamine-phosphate pyrophosphorylase
MRKSVGGFAHLFQHCQGASAVDAVAGGADAAGMDLDDDLDPLDPDFAARFRRDDRRPPCQLYLVSPPETGGGFPDRLARALDAGPVAAFQFRVKGIDQHRAARLAEPLQAICAAREVAFIVNDSVSLAKRLGADGVHLGQDDGDPREARTILGPSVQIGVTCHDSRHLAMEAGEAGADYVAFGAFHPTTTKEVRHRPEPAILSWWAALFEIPSVAIGGITPGNAAPLVAAGADFLAVSAAVWSGDEAAAVKAFAGVLGAGSPALPGSGASSSMDQFFTRIAGRIAGWAGQPLAFIVAITLMVVWALSGPVFHYSDTWQLVVNTATTIVTFLMVFLIQNAQNRDAAAMQAKLDELIRAMADARNQFIGIEHRTDSEIQRIRTDLERECADDKSAAVVESVGRLRDRF